MLLCASHCQLILIGNSCLREVVAKERALSKQQQQQQQQHCLSSIAKERQQQQQQQHCVQRGIRIPADCEPVDAAVT